jgi:hypothetical protein
MVSQVTHRERDSALLQILTLVDDLPFPTSPENRNRPRGRSETYPLCLFVKAALIMIAKRLNKVHELLQTLAEPTIEMQRLMRCSD